MENGKLLFTVEDVVTASGGRLLCGKKDTVITGMGFDSRTMREGYLFVPLPGEHVDGHQFIGNALEYGAVATLTSQHDTFYGEESFILVEDTKTAMQDIAAEYRKRLTLPIVGITGSVGKTTTRSMIAQALSASKEVYQTQGNLNSQLGVPVMVMNIGREEIAVLEMGMSEFGEMERLSRIVCPDIAVITCIGVAHIEQLKTRENICKEKMTITYGMDTSGILLLNGDDEILRIHKRNVKQKVYLYGTGNDCEFRAEEIGIVDGKAVFDAVCLGDRYPVTLSMPGRHNVLNAMAALAVCHFAGVPLDKAVGKLNEFGGVPMRQQIYRTQYGTVIDDSYNANPDSMKAGLSVLMELPKEGRAVAVLGDMYELGEEAVRYHEEIGSHAAEVGVDMLITVGNLAVYMDDKARNGNTEVVHINSKEELIPYLKENINPRDVVLIKASRGMQLNVVADALRGLV